MSSKWYATLGLILLLAGIFVSCRPTAEPTATSVPPTATPIPPTATPVPPTATPVPPTVVTPTPAPAPIVSADEVAAVYEQCAEPSQVGRKMQDANDDFRDLVYVRDQVILVGPTDLLAPLADALGLVALEHGFDIVPRNGTSVRLYDTSLIDGSDQKRLVEQVLCAVNGLQTVEGREQIEGLGRRVGIAADPNYHMSPAGWSGGGSPWTQNGQWAQPGGGMGTPPNSAFEAQWAFAPTIGVHLIENGQYMVTSSSENRARIGIFDTSPFSDTLGIDGERENTTLDDLTAGPDNVPPEFADMRLTVWHVPPVIAEDCPGGKREDQDISNHGLFVTSLAHTVAPASNLYLVRVLEDDGCGSLITIGEGITRFVSQTLQDTGTMSGTIINLSLGVHVPPDAVTYTLPVTVTSLSQVLHSAIDAGAIVVAAAGNDSYASEQPVDMEIPASDPKVIGVASSNSLRERACFSNADLSQSREKLAAPGGEGIIVTPTPDASGHQIRCIVPDCMETPENCLIGLVYKPLPDYEYAYWLGTSFSTPLVTGAVALTLEQAGPMPPAEMVTMLAHNGSCSAADLPWITHIPNVPKIQGTTVVCP